MNRSVSIEANLAAIYNLKLAKSSLSACRSVTILFIKPVILVTSLSNLVDNSVNRYLSALSLTKSSVIAIRLSVAISNADNLVSISSIPSPWLVTVLTRLSKALATWLTRVTKSGCSCIICSTVALIAFNSLTKASTSLVS